jgi:hypothetical protein
VGETTKTTTLAKGICQYIRVDTIPFRNIYRINGKSILFFAAYRKGGYLVYRNFQHTCNTIPITLWSPIDSGFVLKAYDLCCDSFFPFTGEG